MFGIIRAVVPAGLIPEFLCAFLISPAVSGKPYKIKQGREFVFCKQVSYYFICFNEVLMKEWISRGWRRLLQRKLLN